MLRHEPTKFVLDGETATFGGEPLAADTPRYFFGGTLFLRRKKGVAVLEYFDATGAEVFKVPLLCDGEYDVYSTPGGVFLHGNRPAGTPLLRSILKTIGLQLPPKVLKRVAALSKLPAALKRRQFAWERENCRVLFTERDRRDPFIDSIEVTPACTADQFAELMTHFRYWVFLGYDFIAALRSPGAAAIWIEQNLEFRDKPSYIGMDFEIVDYYEDLNVVSAKLKRPRDPEDSDYDDVKLFRPSFESARGGLDRAVGALIAAHGPRLLYPHLPENHRALIDAWDGTPAEAAAFIRERWHLLAYRPAQGEQPLFRFCSKRRLKISGGWQRHSKHFTHLVRFARNYSGSYYCSHLMGRLCEKHGAALEEALFASTPAELRGRCPSFSERFERFYSDGGMLYGSNGGRALARSEDVVRCTVEDLSAATLLTAGGKNLLGPKTRLHGVLTDAGEGYALRESAEKELRRMAYLVVPKGSTRTFLIVTEGTAEDQYGKSLYLWGLTVTRDKQGAFEFSGYTPEQGYCTWERHSSSHPAPLTYAEPDSAAEAA